MGSRFGFAGGIPERRVRPIWDAVDSRQYKAAHKLVVSLLAKHPKSPYALALKALILERLGKLDEALSVCFDAKNLLHFDSMIHIDELTLSTLQIVFQRLDRLDLATSCYEYACGKHPNNLEIMGGLFNCYLREYSFVKQQQIAIKMYKIMPEEKYLLWAVCSIQLQVSLTDDRQKQLLQLAEALLKKHITSHSLHEPEALSVYLDILERQGKYSDALELLFGSLGSLVGIQEDKLRIQGRLLARACNYTAAAETFQRVLHSCPDDWETFLNYLSSLMEVDINWSKRNTAGFSSEAYKAAHLTEEMFDSRIVSALSFVHKLQVDSESSGVRGPFLASIEIERWRRIRGNYNDDKLLEALLNYFYRFGHLSCFTSDVEMFSYLLTEQERSDLLEKYKESLKTPSESQIRALGQAITVYKVQGLFGTMFTLSIRELKDIAKKMLEMYCKSLALSKDLDPQENMHGEELLTLASNILALLFWRTKKFGYLLETIMVLEFGLTIRRYVWQYKISLLHLYSFIGALPLAYEWYRTLEVKNILLESTSHHILPQMMKSPLLMETTDLLNEYLKFMDDHSKEAADLTFLAYRHRNYTKAIEFVKFKERLEHSQQLVMARLDSSILLLEHKADSLESLLCILKSSDYGTELLDMSKENKLKSLVCNEDLQARPWWTPTCNVNFLSEPFEEKSALKENPMKYKAVEEDNSLIQKVIERKSLIPRLVYLSIQTGSILIKENEHNGSLSNAEVTVELRSLLERYARSIGFSLDDAISVILGISKGQRSLKDFDSDVISWMNFSVFLNAWKLCCHEVDILNEDASGLSSWHIVDIMFNACIVEQLMHAEPVVTTPGSNFSVLVQLVTECFSWHMLVIQSCVRSMTLPSGKKKKKSGSIDHQSSPHMQAIHDSVKCLSDAIKQVQKWVADQVKTSEDRELDAILYHLRSRDADDDSGCVCDVLEENLSASNSELGERILASLQSWNSANICRKIVEARRKLLLHFLDICDSKLKVLRSLRPSM